MCSYLTLLPNSNAGAGGVDGRQPKTLVFFLGGCTYAEISAIRFLGSLIGREFTIATTNMLNGTTMLVRASSFPFHLYAGSRQVGQWLGLDHLHTPFGRSSGSDCLCRSFLLQENLMETV